MQRSAIERALGQIVHRRPDDAGIIEGGQSFEGMRRLAIFDLNGGHQLVFKEDRAIAVVFNGEIYNYRGLADDLIRSGHEFRTASDN